MGLYSSLTAFWKLDEASGTRNDSINTSQMGSIVPVYDADESGRRHLLADTPV